MNNKRWVTKPWSFSENTSWPMLSNLPCVAQMCLKTTITTLFGTHLQGDFWKSTWMLTYSVMAVAFQVWSFERWDRSTVGIATRAHQFVTDALEGEALGLSDAIDMVESYNGTDVIFELDNQVIVHAVQRRSQIRRQWGHAVQRCINFIKRNPRSSISWVSRKGNWVAHGLARWAKITILVIGPIGSLIVFTTMSSGTWTTCNLVAVVLI
jgi:hypothetical protein